MKKSDNPKADPVAAVVTPTGAYRTAHKKRSAPVRPLRKVPRRTLGTEDVNCYHVTSRTALGDRPFGEQEKEAFVKLMRHLEEFSGVEILTYVVMGDHFHLLVRVPDRNEFLGRFEGPKGEKQLLAHLKTLYSPAYLKDFEWQLDDLRKRGEDEEVGKLLARFTGRLCRLEPFMKELKERFTRWFNKYHSRRGALWMERYKAVVVEPGEALATIAAYIDLNPVRAELCEDPKDYPWCGYSEAMSGGKRARQGLCRVLDRQLDSWEQKPSKDGLTAAQLYRGWLFGQQGNADEVKGLTTEQLAQLVAKGGKLSREQLLRRRVKYFTHGVAIGGRDFVEEVFEQHRESFGAKRKNGARRIVESEPRLFALRALRKGAVE